MTPVTNTLTAIADDLAATVTAIGDVRGRDRNDLVFILRRIIESATRGMESIGKRKKRRTPDPTGGFDTDNDWSDLIVRSE